VTLKLGLLPSDSTARLALRGRHLLVVDFFCIALAFVLAFALRLDAPSPEFHRYLVSYAWLVLPLLAIRIGANVSFKLYQRLWRYASIEEMQAIVLATSVGSLLFGIVLLVLSFGGYGWPAYGFPRSIVGIEWLLSTALLGASRFSLRSLHAGRRVFNQNLVSNRARGGTSRVIIVGAGDAGAMVARELDLRPGLDMEPVGFVDDDPLKRSKWVHRVQIIGSLADLSDLVTKLDVDSVIVAMPSAPGTIIRQILQICGEIGVKVMTVPGMAELISGKVSVSQIRPVDVQDLLRREPASIDMRAAAGFLEGAVVLVTGAGGSIGAELCRQIASFKPKRIVLLGRGENSIYHIQTELEPRYRGSVDFVPIIADVRDMPRLKAVFDLHQPSIVFHAAAHKHVPLMEANPSEAVATNVFGTRNVLEVSSDAGVESFVLVSTDKAVNPANVMGATKRIAELLLQETAARTGRRYVAVRFGNVLGSRGSVIPLFKQQIAAGGPLTITHPDITRYFMTIPEAAQLIIQAAAMGGGGEIFVLDMGTPVRIYDLALDLIRLSGLETFRDIDIEVTGLRAGEKLYEELFTLSEQHVSTQNSRIFVSALQPYDKKRLETGLQELDLLVATGRSEAAELREALTGIVPEFSSATPTGARARTPIVAALKGRERLPQR
jgi:FlaA1/EpsC-like NDP-sugar epimerase